ncbi:MAG: hypothetical protein ABF893_12485 [Gluconacetobacter liquefaciens]|uniref:Uncharacterized protein n=1 Tax=Gluconacetobacter liquefaciens TaxID=89584 RepID=A0A370G967_GLULI|nr:hypothetical protein [Gluconacetobacter liquefaciens]RDI40352.1 hypothetical protein C7453_101145 [Gluconacetobacter liquefaciens]
MPARRRQDQPPIITGQVLLALHAGLGATLALMAWWCWSLPS